MRITAASTAAHKNVRNFVVTNVSFESHFKKESREKSTFVAMWKQFSADEIKKNP